MFETTLAMSKIGGLRKISMAQALVSTNQHHSLVKHVSGDCTSTCQIRLMAIYRVPERALQSRQASHCPKRSRGKEAVEGEYVVRPVLLWLSPEIKNSKHPKRRSARMMVMVMPSGVGWSQINEASALYLTRL